MAKPVRRQKWIVVPLVLACPLIGLLMIPRQAKVVVINRPLTQVGVVNGWHQVPMAGNVPYQWKSDHQILVNHNNGSTNVLDTLSQQETPLSALATAARTNTDLRAYADAPPNDWLLSPDGKWLLTHPLVNGKTKWAALNLVTGQVVSYAADVGDAPSVVWNHDSSGWIHLTHDRQELLASIYPITPPYTVSALPLFKGRHGRGVPPMIGTTNRDNIVVARWEWMQSDEFYCFNVSIDSPNDPQQYDAKLPTGAQISEVELSPRGDQLAWVFYVNGGNQASQRLSRIFPFIHGPTATGQICVSRLNGGQMHEIWEHPLAGRHPMLPQFLRWTPDSTRISFAYTNTLYTVPAE